MNKSVDIGKIREQIVQFVSFGYSVAEIDVADMVNICDEIERLRAEVETRAEQYRMAQGYMDHLEAERMAARLEGWQTAVDHIAQKWFGQHDRNNVRASMQPPAEWSEE